MKHLSTILALAAVVLVAPPISAQPQRPYLCATSSTDVNIRDARTLRPVGKLNYGECLEPYRWNPRGNSFSMRTIDGESYYVTIGGKSGQLRLVAANYVGVVWR
jgi:hypothetical protein